ncbi:hypothetical protein THAOC_13704, partial [Thalassiosira oceanica]
RFLAIDLGPTYLRPKPLSLSNGGLTIFRDQEEPDRKEQPPTTTTTTTTPKPAYIPTHRQMDRATTTSSPASKVSATTERDVISGKGKGVQRGKGNMDYRKAVKAHKVGVLSVLSPSSTPPPSLTYTLTVQVLYAMCMTNKAKISNGIVKAIRTRGGRFLKLDERTGVYSELDDTGKNGALEKTSQALREKQTEIRKQIHDFNETSWDGIPNTQFSDEEFYQYSLHVFASIHGEHSDLSDLPAPVKKMVEISNLGANFVSSPDREEISFPALLAPASSRHSTMLARARDQFPGVEPDKSRKHGMPADEASAPNKRRSMIGTGSTRNDSLGGREMRSDYRPGSVVHRQDVSHSDAWEAPILKNGDHVKPEETNKDDPMDDLRLTMSSLGSWNVCSNSRPSFLPTTSGSRLSQASIGSWNSRLTDTSLAIDPEMLESDCLEMLDQAVSSENFARAGEPQQDVRQLDVRQLEESARRLEELARRLVESARRIKAEAVKDGYVHAEKQDF